MAENIFFVSDTHFGHRRIHHFCPNTRQGSTIDEHDEILIANWREQVKPGDRVYHLGDAFFGDSVRTREILSQLTGNIHFIYGNHDSVVEGNADIRKRFASVSHYKELRLDGIKVCLFHFPIHEWHHIHKGAFHLYGHVHGTVQIPGRAMDVGIDTRPNGDMRLWSWEEVKAILSQREVLTHHGKKEIP